MFDKDNLVCRLFAAYVLRATHAQYTLEGCIWIANRFYEHVDKFQEYEDAYQRAARRTPLGYSAFFENAERQYDRALSVPTSELGKLLIQAENLAKELGGANNA